MKSLFSRTGIFALALVGAAAFLSPTVAPAQWGAQILNGNTVTRPINGPTYLLSQDAATTSSISSAGVLVNAYSIATGSTVASGSITNPLNARTLAIRVHENSGTSIRGTLKITGRNQFDQACVSYVNMGTDAISNRYAETGIAYTFITGIDYSGITNRAASDTLSISPGSAYGLPYRSSNTATAALRFVVALTSTGAVQTPAANAGTWDTSKSTFTPASALTVPAFLTTYGFSDLTTEAGSSETVTAAASF